MKIIFLLTILNLLCLGTIAQSTIKQDKVTSDILVMFNRVRYSDNWSSKAELTAKYLQNNGSVLLSFEVPNYDFRFQTTLNDYATVKFDDNDIKLQNMVESNQNERGHHIFVFELPREKWTLFLKHQLKSITFYFAPNEEFIAKKIATYKGFGTDDKSRKQYIELAKKTVKTTISKPEKKQYNTFIAWLEKF